MACGLHVAQLAKGGFKFLSLSCPAPPPQNGNHRALISHFTGVNSPFSTASAGSPHSPSLPLCSPPLACAQPSVVYWTEHLEGLAFHHGSCWHHVPLRSGGWPTARRPLLHTPWSIPLRTLPSIASFTWPWLKPVVSIVYQIPV